MDERGVQRVAITVAALVAIGTNPRQSAVWQLGELLGGVACLLIILVLLRDATQQMGLPVLPDDWAWDTPSPPWVDRVSCGIVRADWLHHSICHSKLIGSFRLSNIWSWLVAVILHFKKTTTTTPFSGVIWVDWLLMLFLKKNEAILYRCVES